MHSLGISRPLNTTPDLTSTGRAFVILGSPTLGRSGHSLRVSGRPPAHRADHPAEVDTMGTGMTATKPERAVVVITDETTRSDLAVTLGLLNDNAKRIHRRGYVGVASEAYVLAHRRINAVLTDWEDARP